MANIKRIDGKTGVSFQITVTQGRDINGRQVRHYKTWKPEGRMTERQMQKAVERAAADFEREIEQGYQTDNRQTFSEYARYVIGLKRTAGAKGKTLSHYEYLLSRCDQAIGHLRLCDIRPQHLNLFYQNLQEEGVRQGRNRAAAKGDLGAYLRERKITRETLAEKPVSPLPQSRRPAGSSRFLKAKLTRFPPRWVKKQKPCSPSNRTRRRFPPRPLRNITGLFILSCSRPRTSF